MPLFSQNCAPNGVQSRAGRRPVSVRMVLQEVDHGSPHCLQLSVGPCGEAHPHTRCLPRPAPRTCGVCHAQRLSRPRAWRCTVLMTVDAHSRRRRSDKCGDKWAAEDSCTRAMGTGQTCPTTPTPGSEQAGQPLTWNAVTWGWLGTDYQASSYTKMPRVCTPIRKFTL